MNTMTFHIVDKDQYLSLKHLYNSSHYVQLPGNNILVCIDFIGAHAAEAFLELATTATHLPHPIFDCDVLVTEQQAQTLSQCCALFPDCQTPEERLTAARKMCCCHVSARAKMLHPLMKLSTF